MTCFKLFIFRDLTQQILFFLRSLHTDQPLVTLLFCQGKKKNILIYIHTYTVIILRGFKCFKKWKKTSFQYCISIVLRINLNAEDKKTKENSGNITPEPRNTRKVVNNLGDNPAMTTIEECEDDQSILIIFLRNKLFVTPHSGYILTIPVYTLLFIGQQFLCVSNFLSYFYRT